MASRLKLAGWLGVLLAGVCLGQLDTAAIVGTVFDSGGGVIAGATITIQNEGTAATYSFTTDGSGSFIAPVLPIGMYRITVAAKGFKTAVREGIRLRVADRTRVDVSLETGDISEKITVTGEAALLETASTTLGAVIGTQQVSELPINGRSISGLLGLAPGVVMLGGGTQRSMNGTAQNRLFEAGTRFLLDGGDSGQVDSDIADSAYASTARVTRASVDAIAEFRIQESSFSSEYGNAMGGVVNFITKSGTNSYHGGLFEYFRNEKLDARNYFNPVPTAKPPFRLNQFGGTFGGRIVRDRLFFFLNFEGVRQRLGIFQNTFTPTQAFRDSLTPVLRAAVSILPLPNGPLSAADPRLGSFRRGVSNQLTENTGAVKVDWQASSADRVTMRYAGNAAENKTWYGVGDGQFRPVPSLLTLARITYTRVLSPGLLNEAGVAFNRGDWKPVAGGTDAVLNSPIVGSVAGMAPLGPTLFDLRVANNSFTYQDTLTWVKGRQQFKFGAQIVRNQANKAILFQGLLAFITLNDFAANRPLLAQTLGQPRMGMRNTYNNFFVQDDIQLNSRLTLNLGLRYQYDTAPSESHGRIANFDPVTGTITKPGATIVEAPKNNWGPRAGLAWRITKSTVLRTGGGIFFSSLNPAFAQQMPGNVPGIAQNAVLVGPPQGFPFPNVTPATTGLALYSMPIDWHTANTAHWNLNLQQGFGQSNLLQVSYIGNRGWHTSPIHEINPINRLTGRRPYPQFSTISNFYNGANSNYNTLQVSFRRRLTKGLTFNVNYGWAHSLDEGGVNFGSGPSNPSSFRQEYGNADYDARHNFQLDYTYQLPSPKVMTALLGGWQINGISVMRSGLPFNIVCGCDSGGIGAATARPDLVPGVPLRPSNYDIPNAQVNLAAFRTPAAGTFGTLGRNVLRGPAAFNWDFSLFKSFKIQERHTFQFRAEVFNIFNIPQFSNPSVTLTAPTTFGRSFSTIPAVGGFGTNRQIQFALRYAF